MDNGVTERLGVEAKPDKGCERFLSIEVNVTRVAAAPGWYEPLVGKAKPILRELLGEPPYVALMGKAKVAWKDDQARNDCIAYQMGWRPSRWDDVLKYAELLSAGKSFNHGPTFVHPTATASSTGLLQPIDGARRLMASAEAGGREIPALIVLGKPADIDFEWEVSSFGTFDAVLKGVDYGSKTFQMPMQPFTRDDVNAAAKGQLLEPMPMNSFVRQWREAEAKGRDAWHKWFRNYNIRRTAYLVENGIGSDPILLQRNSSRRDGNHRLLAAICRGDRTIKCVYERVP
jgi:hypothetical protein